MLFRSDQILHLEFDRDTCIWKLTKAENEISDPPPDPLLESIAKLLTPLEPNWTGTSSELLLLLGDVELQPNTLTRRLNISVDRVLNEYGITYHNQRTRNGSSITLSFVDVEEIIEQNQEIHLECDDVTVI